MLGLTWQPKHGVGVGVEVVRWVCVCVRGLSSG